MEVEFVNILNGIESSNYDPETKGKLQWATMLLWQLRDMDNGGTGIVTWNGMSTTAIPNPSTSTQAPIAEEPKEEPQVEEQTKPKIEEQTKKQPKPKKVKVELKKDLGLDLDDFDVNDIFSGF